MKDFASDESPTEWVGTEITFELVWEDEQTFEAGVARRITDRYALRMKSGRPLVRRAQFLVRLQRLTRDIEELVQDLEPALGDGYDSRLLVPAARSLQRAASAAKAVVDGASAGPVPGEIRAVLEGTSPLLSLLGSRLVLTGTHRSVPQTPSIGAQALAVLLEAPGRAFDASEIAARVGCSVPIARTTLHRLVRSGHAMRPAAGRFRARAR